MRATRKLKTYDATCFYGSDPASSAFDRLFTDSKAEAIAFTSRGTMGTVSRTDDGFIVFSWPKR